MLTINNKDILLKEELKEEIKQGSRLSIIAAYFSIYAYEELKEELENIEEFRFIFSTSTFIKEQSKKESREFYIPQLSREKGICGTEFEIKLKNELSQKSIARECASWIRGKCQFKSNKMGGIMQGNIVVNKDVDSIAYSPINEFTTTELGVTYDKNSSSKHSSVSS